MNRRLPPTLFTLILGFLLAGNAGATTYYIAANGSDSSSGISKTTPFAHAPGMANCTGTCASTSLQAGDSVIFRGGDTWEAASWPMNPSDHSNTGGNSSNPIYFGVDKTWYTGSSWVRPIFSGNGTYPGASASPFLQMSYFNYWTVDNIEFTGLYWSFSGNGAAYISCDGTGCTNFEVKNCYVHGWTHASGVTDSGEFLYLNGAETAAASAHNNVIDGSDTAENSFAVFYGGPGIIYQNYVDQVVNVIDSNITGTLYVHDNTFLNIVCDYDGVTHGNVIQNNPPSAGVFVYNNLVAHMSGCTFPLNMQAGTNSTNYFFNNVYWDNRGGIAIALTGYAYGSTGATFNAFNNTIENGPDSGTPSNPLYTLETTSGNNNETWNLYNTHGITTGAFNTTPTGTGQTVNGTASTNGNLMETKTVANSYGYTSSQTYPFVPTSSSSPTVGKGNKLGGICNGISDSTAQAACLSDTTLGVAEVSGSGGYIVSAPNHLPVANPPSGSWDIGAYQFVTVVPPTGLVAVVH